MRRALLPILFLLAFPAAADATSVKVVDCVPAVDPVARAATFEARVRSARHSARMQVRFTLQVREDGMGRWRRIVADGLDTWLTSNPGVRRYTYDKTVQNLAAPAAYRMLVRFRWLDGDGGVLKGARRRSAVCRQPDLRPDLSAQHVDVMPGIEPGTGRYAVSVRNAGRSTAGAFAVSLRSGAGVLAPVTVPALAAGERRVVTFTGPACAAGEALTVSVDPDDDVDERDDDDNVLHASCPG